MGPGMQDEAQANTGPPASDRSLASAAISPSSLGRTAGMLITVLSLIGLPLTPFIVPAAILTGEVLAWLSQRLRLSEARLLRLDDLKNEFIGMVAHDMRTPIVVIRGFAERLREDASHLTESQLDEYIVTIERNAKRASE